jgi:metacaspase-1
MGRNASQLPDRNDDEELDTMDETWCLYNGQHLDDERYELLGEFAEGVRILVFSDSCHSGTTVKDAYFMPKLNMRITNVDVNGVRYRFMPDDMVLRTYRINKDFYDKILKRKDLKDTEDKVKASALLISACQDNQLSAMDRLMVSLQECY